MMKKKLNIKGFALLIGCLLLGACSDQTDDSRIPTGSGGKTIISFQVKAAQVESRATVATEKNNQPVNDPGL